MATVGLQDFTFKSSAEIDAPVAALRPSSRTLLSTMLNPVKVIPTESGLPRDWRGVAELAGIPSEQISYFQSKADPTAELLQFWYKTSDSRCQSFCDLKAFLAVIDRFDVMDDISPLLVVDAQMYKESQHRSENLSDAPLDSSIDKNILTIEDSERIHKGLPLTRYDAFILYAEEDSHFADQIIQKLEEEYGHKLCVKDRDLLPGVMFENEVIGRLIEERCNRFLVVFSPNFLKSTANQFLVSYAQASALESRQRKIIPCVYEPCELPPSVRYSFCIKYNRSGRLYNFWDKLSHSLRSSSSNTRIASPEKLKDLVPDECSKWWDVEKPPQKPTHYHETSPPPSYSQTMRSDISKNKNKGLSGTITKIQKNLKLEDETASITSDAHLISPEKTKKWYNKLKNPIKKKYKDKSNAKQQAIAEETYN